jgi:hypothetical protein
MQFHISSGMTGTHLEKSFAYGVAPGALCSSEPGQRAIG